MENVDHDKWWCPECLKRKVKQARLGECRCGQVEGVHEHTAPPELTATEIQERRARENLDK
jgi:hypothetical protein